MLFCTAGSASSVGKIAVTRWFSVKGSLKMLHTLCATAIAKVRLGPNCTADYKSFSLYTKAFVENKTNCGDVSHMFMSLYLVYVPLVYCCTLVYISR